MTLSSLLRCAAVLEFLAGLALMLAPVAAVGLLFGSGLSATGATVGRLGGVALFSIGMACWGATSDEGGPALTSTVRGITFYNVGAGCILIAAATSGRAAGLLIWIAAILHVGLAAAFLKATIGVKTVA